MEATYSSETLVEIQRTTRRFITEDITFHDHRSDNLKFYMFTELLANIYIGLCSAHLFIFLIRWHVKVRTF
jgi:hypothetical protein